MTRLIKLTIENLSDEARAEATKACESVAGFQWSVTIVLKTKFTNQKMIPLECFWSCIAGRSLRKVSILLGCALGSFYLGDVGECPACIFLEVVFE